MQATAKPYLGASSDLDPGNVNFTPRRAVGYVRVSTDMQANEGVSLDAQTAAIEQYCILHGLKLHSICRDVVSGAQALVIGNHPLAGQLIVHRSQADD